ncbi:thiamine-phosphate kinase [Thermoflavimicrobium daqui]|uniref:thiamine-phosphate kinase n=1 Tax=Thermoflavimicrobium daqui TaxID=2137476 RepID=UPI00143DC2F8|nr:thiamine-phosphate kinase [Thermoflavimicrobium daqui]
MNGEFSFIHSLLAHRQIQTNRIEVDVGDDAAVVVPHPNRSLVMTCDTMVETIHFLRETMQPFDIGWKLLASNLSDIAAMGGVPTYALVSVAVPPSWALAEIEEIYHGIYTLANQYQVTIMGGDTVKAPSDLTLTITLLGEIEHGQALLRSSAKPGDIVFVSGVLGDSAAGLHLLLNHPTKTEHFPKLVAAHCRPQPQIEIGRKLVETGFRLTCDDISDGLAQEAWEIARASQVAIVLDKDKIPLSHSMVQFAKKVQKDPYEWVWFGGEDYQLIGTVSQENWVKLKQMAKELGFCLTRIGHIETGEPTVKVNLGGTCMTLPQGGYNHFADR